MQIKWVAVLTLVVASTGHRPACAGTLSICATHFKGDGSDFAAEFAHGAITVPAGTVFDYAGHAFNGPMDPKDDTHRPPAADSWVGISEEERKRREQVIKEDLSTDSLENQHHSAVVTMAPVVLTKRHLCASVDAKAFIANDWRDDATTIFADPDIYFQSFGVVQDNRLTTDFDDDSNAFNFASARGELNAIVTKTLDHTFTLPSEDKPDN